MHIPFMFGVMFDVQMIWEKDHAIPKKQNPLQSVGYKTA